MHLALHAPLQTFHYDPLDRICANANQRDTGQRRVYCGTALVSEMLAAGNAGYLRARGQLLAIRHGAAVTICAVDQQGSVVSATETLSGNVSYTPHGFTGSPGLLGYCAERAEAESDVYLLGNGYRAYDPASMRFRSPDNSSPFGRGGHNAYAYCHADPINRSDPTGHFDWIHGLTLGFIALGIVSTLISAGNAAPAFSAMSAMLAGAPVVAGSVTTVAVIAAVAVTAGVLASLTQVASLTMSATANGDANLIKTSRIIGIVGGALGALSTLSGLLAGKLAVLAAQEATLVAQESELALTTILNSSRLTTARGGLLPPPRNSFSTLGNVIRGRPALALGTPTSARLQLAARALSRQLPAPAPVSAAVSESLEMASIRSGDAPSTEWEVLYSRRFLA